jgi:hypothetical protein
MKIFLADNFLRLETLYRHDEGELVEASPFKFRSLSTARDTLVDMREIKNQNRVSFKILSPEVEESHDFGPKMGASVCSFSPRAEVSLLRQSAETAKTS